MQAMARVQGEIKCIPTNTEKYISFSLGNLRFIDSVNFLLSSLDKLVKGSDEFPIMNRMVAEENKLRLLLKKGIYPYEYMDSFERLRETKLPDKEKFSSSLSGKGITDEEYVHAQEVWAAFGCQNLGDYHNLYVALDSTLLAEVFENFRKVCLDKYGLDPAHYYSAPGLSWDALLKTTGVELDLLGSLSKPRRRRQRERHKTKGLMSRTIAVHVHYKSLSISLPSSVKRQLEMTKFCVVYGTWTTTAKFSYFHLELNAVVVYLASARF